MANLIERYPVPLIYKKILQDSLSGELEIRSGKTIKTLYFKLGALQYAVSNVEQDRLGEVLYSTDRISFEQRIMLRKMRECSQDKYGKIVVQHRILTKQDLYAGLKDQVRAIAVSAFFLDSGNWTFTSREASQIKTQRMSLDLAEIIINGIKTQHNVSYYRERFRFRSPVTMPIPEATGKLLDSEEIKFYVKLTKCGSISSEQIISVLNLDERRFWQEAAMLYLLSVIDFTEFRVSGSLNRQVEMINDLHDKLASHTIDHYELLDLKDTASVADVRDKYFSFSKKYAPESVSAAPDSRTMEKSGFIITKAAQALETLTDLDKKKAYDTGTFQKIKAAPKPDDSQKDKHQKARNLYLNAHNLYEQKRYLEAARHLEEAVQLEPTRASYLLLLGLSQSHVASMRPYAEKNLKKVSELEPWNADPLFYLGKLYWTENLVNKAEHYFRLALSINMEHTLAARMVKKIEGRIKKKPKFSMFSKKK